MKPAAKLNWNFYRCLGVPVLLCLAILVSISVFIIAVRTVLEGVDSKSWSPTQAVIQKLEEEIEQGVHGAGIYLHVQYEYLYSNKVFVSDRIAFLGFVSSSARRKMQDWQVGTIVTAYVNPNKPTRAVLYRGVPKGVVILTGVSGGVSILLSFFLFVFSRSKDVREAVLTAFLRQS